MLFGSALDVLPTPCGHEDGDADGGVIVEDSRDPRVHAAVGEVAVVAQVVALGTRDELQAGRVADVLSAHRTTQPSAVAR